MQKFGLEMRRHFRDFIEKQSSFISLFKFTGSVENSASKSTFVY